MHLLQMNVATFFICLVVTVTVSANDEKVNAELQQNDANAQTSSVVFHMNHDPKYTGVCATYSAFGGKIPDTSFVDGKPFFSWDHIPVYWHGGSKGGLSDDAIGYISHHPFATVALEKFEGIYKFPRAGNAETKFMETAAKIKAMNPKSQILFFQNTVISFPNYELDCYLRKNNMHLKNDNNVALPFTFHSYYPYGSCNGADSYYSTNVLKIFDHSDPRFLPYWRQRLENLTNSDLFSGVFADRIIYGLPGQNKAAKWRGRMSDARIARWFKDFTTAINIIGEVVFAKKKIVIGNNRSFDLSPTQPYGRMYEIFMIGPNSRGSTPYFQVMSFMKDAQERIVHIHGDSCYKDTHVRTLAGFLIGACKYSYYACSNRFEISSESTSPLCWKDDYNKKLGAPLGKAKISYKSTGIRFYRKFASGTKVFLTVPSETSPGAVSCICYSDGTASCYSANCAQMERDFINNYMQPLDQWENDGCA